MNRFRTYLRQAARDGRRLLAEFDTPPVFELWNNPVLSASWKYESLNSSGDRSLAGVVFDACDAGSLCDDGHVLQDAGINAQYRLWLVYRFDSLTDFTGDDKYTTIVALLSMIKRDDQTMDVWYGFDWRGNDSLGWLIFDHSERKLSKRVFSDQNWRALIRLD